MAKHKGYAERIELALTKPMVIKPGDSAFKKTLRITYGILSPVIVGPAVLAGFAADDIRSLGHIHEIATGMGEFKRTPMDLRKLPAAVQQLPRAAALPQPQKPPSPALTIPTVPKLTLSRPRLGQSIHKPSFGFRTPKLHVAAGLRLQKNIPPPRGQAIPDPRRGGLQLQLNRLNVRTGHAGSARIQAPHRIKHGPRR